jgi:hypothetical protein
MQIPLPSAQQIEREVNPQCCGVGVGAREWK